MPYITESQRKEAETNPLYGRGDPGILNYRLTKLVVDWLGKDPRYADFNAAIGALECARMELYRRLIAEHEDNAIARNGDVFPSWLVPEPPTEMPESEPPEDSDPKQERIYI